MYAVTNIVYTKQLIRKEILIKNVTNLFIYFNILLVTNVTVLHLSLSSSLILVLQD